MGLLRNIKQLFANITFQVLSLLVKVRRGKIKFIYTAPFRYKTIQSVA